MSNGFSKSTANLRQTSNGKQNFCMKYAGRASKCHLAACPAIDAHCPAYSLQVQLTKYVNQNTQNFF